MRVWEIKGYIQIPGQPQTRFTSEVHAVDRASAVRLATATYAGGTVKVNISSIRDKGKSNLTSN
jgi:hypothetical protein